MLSEYDIDHDRGFLSLVLFVLVVCAVSDFWMHYYTFQIVCFFIVTLGMSLCKSA